MIADTLEITVREGHWDITAAALKSLAPFGTAAAAALPLVRRSIAAPEACVRSPNAGRVRRLGRRQRVRVLLAVAADNHRIPADTVGAVAVEQEQPALVVGAGA
ncbi:hypothetical protein [Embleya hyalina]|uniref:hypothetical protein n=1 Tax=Embleya hyalina TaxID=516124 RepID=UPI00147709F0|nr:hypothetical protein [Embleya hyalina]